MATAYEKAKKNVSQTASSKSVFKKQKGLKAKDLKFSWQHDTLTKKATKGNISDKSKYINKLKNKGLGSIYKVTDVELYDRYIQNLKNNLERVEEIEALESTQKAQGKQFSSLSDTVSSLEDWKATDFKDFQDNLATNTASLDKLNAYDFSGLGDIATNKSNVASLLTRVGNLEQLGTPVTTIGDVSGLTDIISNLQSQYDKFDKLEIPEYTAPDLSGLTTKDQLDKAISGLGINEFMDGMTFEQAMEQRLGTLRDTVAGDFGSEIKRLNLDTVGDKLKEGGQLDSLSENFAGLSSDLSWVKDLGALGLDKRFTDQASNFSTSLSSAEDRMSNRITSAEDRFSDLLGGQTDTLTNLIGETKLNLQGDLEKFETGAQTAREQLESRLSEEGSTARRALADQLAAQGYNIDNLSTQLLGYGDRLTDYQKQFQDDLTDLRGIVGTERELELGKLEKEIGQDRTRDLLQLRKGIEAGTTSEIERMAGNLRQEYGDQLFDLTDTFGKGQEENRLARERLGADIQDLFGRSLAQDVSVAGLTSNVGTLGQNLESLRGAFGDFQSEAASNLGDVQRALQSEIGDLSGSLTSGLANIQTDYLDKILGSERAGASAREDLRSELTGALGSEAAAREAGLASEAAARQSGLASEAAARQSGLATEASAREAGLQSAQAERTRLAQEASRGFQDVYKTREQAISELSGRFGENLRAQEQSLSRRIDDTSRAVDEKIGRLSSMMNYRMLGDSAGGVKMRRSKAYTSGAINTGTGQLSRTMKLKTLNI